MVECAGKSHPLWTLHFFLQRHSCSMASSFFVLENSAHASPHVQTCLPLTPGSPRAASALPALFPSAPHISRLHPSHDRLSTDMTWQQDWDARLRYLQLKITWRQSWAQSPLNMKRMNGCVSSQRQNSPLCVSVFNGYSAWDQNCDPALTCYGPGRSLGVPQLEMCCH